MKRSVYAICYLELKYYQNIKKDLKLRGYSNITPIIPTVRILRKTVKSKMEFDEVPILFNYGFIKMPIDKAYSRDFLRKLVKDIPGIRGWLNSPESLHPKKKKRRRIDNLDIWDDFSIVSTVSKEEVRYFRRLSRKNKRFSMEDLSLNIGDYVVLKNYPFEGVDATILDINYRNSTVKLLMYPENGRMEISLPFDNVIYSVYQNYDEDKLLVNRRDYDPNNITEEAISNVLDLRQY